MKRRYVKSKAYRLEDNPTAAVKQTYSGNEQYLTEDRIQSTLAVSTTYTFWRSFFREKETNHGTFSRAFKFMPSTPKSRSLVHGASVP